MTPRENKETPLEILGAPLLGQQFSTSQVKHAAPLLKGLEKILTERHKNIYTGCFTKNQHKMHIFKLFIKKSKTGNRYTC